MIFFGFQLARQLDRLFGQQNLILRNLSQTMREEFAMVQESLAEMKRAIEHAATVKQAAIVLIKDVHDRLTELADHPTAEAIREMAADLRNHADELAAAIAEHEEGHEEEGEKEEE
jgi:hypothetical protein